MAWTQVTHDNPTMMFLDLNSLTLSSTLRQSSQLKIRVTHPRGVAMEAEVLVPHLGNWQGHAMTFDHKYCAQGLMRALERRLQQSDAMSVQRWKDVTEYHFPSLENG